MMPDSTRKIRLPEVVLSTACRCVSLPWLSAWLSVAVRESPVLSRLNGIFPLGEVGKRAGLHSDLVGLGAHVRLHLLGQLPGSVDRALAVVDLLDIPQARPREVQLQMVVGRRHCLPPLGGPRGFFGTKPALAARLALAPTNLFSDPWRPARD